MASVIRSPESQRDIDDIAYRIGTDNFDAMERSLADLDRTFRLLAEFPGLGPTRPELAPDLKSFPVDSYSILYRDILGGVEIVRVVHRARDLPELFPG